MAPRELGPKLFWVFGLILRWDVASQFPLSAPGVQFQSKSVNRRCRKSVLEMWSAGSKGIQNAQIEILKLFVFKKKTKPASFTRVLYFGSTGHKNCDSTECHVIDKLTLLYPILKLALKVAYFIKYLGICRRMSFTCSSCESFERERDFRRWMLVSGEGGKIEGGSFPFCFLLSNLDIKSRKGFLVPSSPELFLAAAAALQNWSWELSPPLLRPTPPPSLGFRAAPGWAV